MPHERTRAVIETKKLLEELRIRDDIPADVRKDVIWCLRHFPTVSDLKIAGYATTRNGTENPFATSPDYDEHKANMLKIAAKDAATLSVFISEPEGEFRRKRDSPGGLTERMITAPREGDTPDEVADRQEYLDIITMQDSEKKSVRQAEFMKSCEGLSTEEIVNRAKLFQGVDVSRFKIIKMVG